ncbi:MAG TPA: CBS domain-containing protein, partial [Kofleriaceae bacterium]|nr:CBS domain-containing protein [Kofleriaceae bacterium]
TVNRQAARRPVSEWERARLDEANTSKGNYARVENYMETDLFTVHAEDAIEMVVNLMIWERIRYVCVEDSDHNLVGLVSHRAVLRFVQSGRSTLRTPISEIMRREVTTVSPETATLDALRMMRRLQVGCLPVVDRERLIGIVTEGDFLEIASKLLEHELAADDVVAEEPSRQLELPQTGPTARITPEREAQIAAALPERDFDREIDTDHQTAASIDDIPAPRDEADEA